MQRTSSSMLGTKACAECFRAKVRCEAGRGAAICERCERLNKRCVVEPRKIRRPNRANSKPDLVQLQSKVETLEQLFSASLRRREEELGSPSRAVWLPETNTPSDSVQSQHAAYIRSDLQLSPTSKDGEEALAFFQDHMSPIFPFVVVPVGMSPAEVARSKPVLWMAIGLVARWQNEEKRSTLSRVFRSEVGHRVFVGEEKTLDLLQGILVYTAWNHLHQMTLAVSLWAPLLHIAIALMSDLNLDEEPGSSKAAKIGLGALKQFEPPSEPLHVERTLEERRAMLGVFLLSSVSATCLRDVFGLPSIPALQRSKHILQLTQQYTSDNYLVHMAQIQQVADSIRSILYRGFLEAEPLSAEAVLAAFKSLQVSVQNLGKELEEAMSMQPLLIVAYCSLQIYLYKLSLDDRLFESVNFDEGWTKSTSGPNESYACSWRSDLLRTVFNAAQKLLDQFCHLDNSVLASLPYLAWIQLGHAILMHSRVVTASHETGDWMLFFESSSGFRDGVEKLGRKMEQVTSEQGEGEISTRPRLPPIFGRIPAKLGEVRDIVEATVESQGTSVPSEEFWTYAAAMYVPLERDMSFENGAEDAEWV